MGLWPVLFFFCSAALSTVSLIALFRRWKKLTNAQRILFLLSSFSSRSVVILFSEEKPILFEKDLEHTRAYLAVEQACYEGSLFVEFDTPYVYFRVPALTLQPIVENAVKHGLIPGRPPLYISVVTEDTGKGARITVEDTGPGFLLSEDSEPHRTLENIRARLRIMVGGTLTIEPREAGGAKVTIFVPAGEKNRYADQKEN